MRTRDPAKPTVARAYGRVSGREQGERGTSLDAQRARFERYCRGEGYPSPILYVEIESAGEEKREKRVELDRLIADAQPGEIVLVTLTDRWTRDVVDGVRAVRDLLRRGVGWVAIDEGIDARTEHGYEALLQRAAGAEMERRRIRKRTVGRREELRDLGYYAEGPAPFGLRRGERAAKRQLLLEVVGDDAALVREAFERCAGGASVDQVREWLEVESSRAWDKKSVWCLLRNRVYLGEVLSTSGTWIPAAVVGGQSVIPPLITRDLYERAQAAMQARQLGGRRSSATSRTAGWLLRGLASCPECGATMGAAYGGGAHQRKDEGLRTEAQSPSAAARSTSAASLRSRPEAPRATGANNGPDPGKTGEEHAPHPAPAQGYYACARRLRGGTCAAAYVRVDVADAAASAQALGRLRDLRHELSRTSDPPPAARKPRDFAAERTRIRTARERAIDLAAAGTITGADLAGTLARLDGELAKIEVAAAAHARELGAHAPAARRAALADVAALEHAWGAAPVATRREALRTLARSIVLRPEAVEITWTTAAELAAQRVR